MYTSQIDEKPALSKLDKPQLEKKFPVSSFSIRPLLSEKQSPQVIIKCCIYLQHTCCDISFVFSDSSDIALKNGKWHDHNNIIYYNVRMIIKIECPFWLLMKLIVCICKSLTIFCDSSLERENWK